MKSEPKVRNLPDLGNVYADAGLGDLRTAFSARPLPSFGADHISVDSFQIRIPINQVEVIDPTIEGDWLMVHEGTGQVGDKRARANKLIRPDFDIEWKIGDGSVGPGKFEKCLKIAVPAKLLREQYFEGITAQNVDRVYHELQAQKVARFDKAAFLAADCTDIDFKTDAIWTAADGDFRQRIREIAKVAKPSTRRDVGCKLRTSKSNQGIEFMTRPGANHLRPFLKFYHKGVQLLFSTKANQFAKTYLGEVDFSNVVRMEATIKGRKDFRFLYGDSPEVVPTLSNILNMPIEEKRKLFDYAFSIHFDKKKLAPQTRDSLKAGDLEVYQAIKMLKAANPQRTWPELLEEWLSIYDELGDRKEKSRKRKHLDMLHSILEREGKSNGAIWLDDFFWRRRA